MSWRRRPSSSFWRRRRLVLAFLTSATICAAVMPSGSSGRRLLVTVTDAGRFSGRAASSSAGGRSATVASWGSPALATVQASSRAGRTLRRGMLGLGIYVYATCIALAAVVVLMRGISALCLGAGHFRCKAASGFKIRLGIMLRRRLESTARREV